MNYFNKVDIGFTGRLKKQMPTIIIGSLTLIASLAWNDAIKAIIDKYVPPEYKNSQNAWYKIFYAFILTCIIVIVISVILKFSNT
ncbi:hypothetical protein Indivirus_6_39 [Indivirus ILV1]|uniref:Uncharacterized protein n=1 Tax=Indivirus ILV1 TaxID=1977633 RepID=A0A1V0SE35_9VIRU|nr:hypothetical protein Indivirus_6_39 [Indivirus ILV1]